MAQLFLVWGVQRLARFQRLRNYPLVPVVSAILAVILLGERMTPFAGLFTLAIAGVLLISKLVGIGPDFHGGYLRGTSSFCKLLGSRLLQRLQQEAPPPI